MLFDAVLAGALRESVKPLTAGVHLVELERQRLCKVIQAVEEATQHVVAGIQQAVQLAGGGIQGSVGADDVQVRYVSAATWVEFDLHLPRRAAGHQVVAAVGVNRHRAALIFDGANIY